MLRVLGIMALLGALALVAVVGGAAWISRPFDADATARYATDFELPALPRVHSATAAFGGGFVRHVYALPSPYPDEPRDAWIYLPRDFETRPARSLPFVLVAPAGSSMCSGMHLTEGAAPEHLPYLRRGFAVVAFSLDGASFDEEAFDEPFARFHQASGGLLNAALARRLAETRYPALDPDRVFVAGHSSAGRFALLYAEHAPVSAVAAYAPGVRMVRLERAFLRILANEDNHLEACVASASPRHHLEDLTAPTFLFHAEDDQVVDITSTRRFVEALRARGTEVELRTVGEGGHYDSMIDEGIEIGADWLAAQAGLL